MLSGVIYSLRYKPVQTYFAQKAAAYLSRELHTTVSVQGLYFKPFSSLVLNGLHIADRAGDTLLYTRQLAAEVDLWQLRSSRVIVKQLELADGRFFLKHYPDSTNLSFIIDYFNPPTSKPASGGGITLAVRSIALSDISLAYKRTGISSSTSRGIDFNDIRVTKVSGRFTDIDMDNHLFKSTIKQLRLEEQSGFRIRELDALAVVDSHSIELQNLVLETNRSRIGNHLRLEYGSFPAFRNFIDSVSAHLTLHQALIHSEDIAFFAPDAASLNVEATVSGLFSGTVADFVADRVKLTVSDSTSLEGGFSVQGLPNINQTVFDVELTQLATNCREIESLVSRWGLWSAPDIPSLFNRMGNLVYRGRLAGLYRDFTAKGTLETVLGTAAIDLGIQTGKAGHYSAHLSSDDFDLGTLLQQSQVGRGAFTVNIAGKGYTLQDIDSEIDGHMGHVDFNGYRYTGIGIAGKATGMQLSGRAAIDDPNLRLSLNGAINLNSQRPEYAFTAEVAHAQLNELRLLKKESPVAVTHAAISTDFNGRTLNSIEGTIAVRDIRFRTDSSTYSIDSLVLAAHGDEMLRTLQLQSDLAEATLRGTFDLNSIGNYFKSIAMRYAPSMEFDVRPPGTQAFDINLTLRKFEPIAALIAPKLILPSGASLNARFSTADSAAIVNFLVPELSYGNISVTRLIVDESTMGDALRLMVTADRVSAADSLYINNFNLSNVMARDSLHFNLKLSDVTAGNQLDLNGLARFHKTEPIAINLLPSSLILNHEPWQFGGNAAGFINDGKFTAYDFQIANNEQVMQLSGTFSTDATDNVSLTFKNFKLSTFNSITQPAGVEIGGVLNGRMDVSSVLKNPYALADIIARDVRFNQHEIGDVLLRADFDRVSELVNVRLEAARDGIRSMTAAGTYNAAAQTDKLNVKAQLNQMALRMFQPFLGHLVSDIHGAVSADLQVSGSLLAPQINGTCYLHDAAFTVNYLKTPYRINDKVTVDNSTILLMDLTIVDPRNNTAIVNGKVDMRNPLVPDIDVIIDANNFLALNTTFRDNPLYYGTAYGTGKFAFNGPTNAIAIDIQARTDENTRFHIPLNAAGTVSENDFIRFVSHDTLGTPRSQSRLFRGVSMNMDLQVTPEAETSLYTDLGELSGRGEGLLSLRVSSFGDFEMFGDYTINGGQFTFRAQDFINKIFDINSGGTIRWTGQPTEATINLTAVYGQRTSLAPLYNAAGREVTEQRVLAQAEMNLNGSLLRPDITFALNFPNDPYVKDELQSYLSDVNNINQQALSLIVRRSFAPGAAADFSRELNNTLLSAGTELAFNQLNNLITQSLNLNFIDLNIRSLNDASASVRLFNDRLIFTGGVTDRRNLNDLNVFGNRIVTDAELLYLIRKDGRLVLRGSNRLNSRNFLPLTINDNYVSALGLVYRQEFYTFQEYLRRMLTLKRKQEDEKE